jgi:hypothetical protein
MELFEPNFLNGGPDIFFVGSGTHASKGRRARVLPDKGFIYTIKPNEEGSRLQTFSAAIGHVRKEREILDLMFEGEDLEKARATDADLYAERTIRNMAMEAGNIYGRSGFMRGKEGREYAVVWVWNLPANSQNSIKDITEKLGFLPEETALLWNQTEEGLVSDFISRKEPQEEKKEDEELAKLHLATGLEKKALQDRFGRTADQYVKFGIRPFVDPETKKSKDVKGEEIPTILQHYWQKGKKDMPYLGKYAESFSFREFLDNNP